MATPDKVTEPGTLALGEPHPAAAIAKRYIEKNFSHVELILWLESMSFYAIEGNRAAGICATTLDRLLNDKPVSDRYLMGLAIYLRDAKEE